MVLLMRKDMVLINFLTRDWLIFSVNSIHERKDFTLGGPISVMHEPITLVGGLIISWRQELSCHVFSMPRFIQILCDQITVQWV